MLMRFSVSNFMSFRYEVNDVGEVKPTEFALYAGRAEKFKERISHYYDRKVLKFAAVYGANAAGKSNLVKALDCGKSIVMRGLDENTMRNQYCRCVESNKFEPTLFEYEITMKGRCFAYGFTVNLWEGKVLTEWLAELKNADERVIFERDVQKSAYYFDEAFFKTEESMRQFEYFLQDANRINGSLFIYEMERRHLEEEEFALFRMIYKWFQNNLIIIYPKTRIGESYFRFASDNKKLVEILKYFDTGITEYSMKKLNESAFREYFREEEMADVLLRKDEKTCGKTVMRYGDTLFNLEFDKEDTPKISKLLFRHGESEMTYEYGEESDGTQRLIELLEVIMNDNGERTFIIDELDRSLHPQMTKKFVETFFDFSKELNTQLVITTHESNLMDLEVLRRDEIWFAEREKDHSTTLYSLEKFKVRHDKVPMRDYLNGRYGAVPVFKEFDYVWGDKNGETKFTDE